MMSLLNKQDCFVCQPTGSGKSIIFQSLPYFSYLMEQQNPQQCNLQLCTKTLLVISPFIKPHERPSKQLE